MIRIKSFEIFYDHHDYHHHHQLIDAAADRTIWTSRSWPSRTSICNSVLLSVDIQNRVRLDYNRNVIHQQILAVI